MRSKQNEVQGYTELTLHSIRGLGVAVPAPGTGARGHRRPFGSAWHKPTGPALRLQEFAALHVSVMLPKAGAYVTY